MKRAISYKRAVLCLLVVLALPCGCSDDDEDSPYPGVVRWECFEHQDWTSNEVTSCSCFGLSKDEQMGSSDTPVDACSLSCCYVFDGEWGWECRCEEVSVACEEAAKSEAGAKVIASCPPGG